MSGTDKSLQTSMQRTYISYQEWARSNNIYHTLISLVSEVYGFVYLSSFGYYYIIINENITKELQKEVFCHEVEHILYDMPNIPYIIGMDMQYSQIEKEADNFAQAVMEVAANYFY